VPTDLGRDLIAANATSSEALADALFHAATRGIPLPRALLDVGAIDEARLEEELDRHGDLPLLHVVPCIELVDSLPLGLVERLACIPLGHGESRCDRTNVRLAVVDPTDTHAADEVAYHLGAEVTLVRATLTAIEGALARLRAERVSSLPPSVARAFTAAPRATHAVRQATASSQRSMFPQESPSAAANFPISLTRRGTQSDTRTDHTPPYPFGLEQLGAHENEPNFLFPFPRAPEPSTLFPELSNTLFDVDEEHEPIPLSRPARSKTPAELPAVPYPDVGALFAAIRSATERDRVLDLLLAAARTIAKRVGIFVVKRERIVGFRCSSRFGSEQAFRRIEVALEDPNILAQVAHGEPYIGPIPAIQANAALLASLNLSGHDVAITTIHIEGIASLLLLADDVGEPFLVKHRLEDFAKVSGSTLARILRARR
jgi:Type II secretion system (T2SS), protein E, N-terminal domain